MSRNIHIHNKSGHDQEFEVHGWNNNKNMVVHPNATSTIVAKDGSSGAIITLHQGHEGEQAEITKKGFGGMSISKLSYSLAVLMKDIGNDFIDISNIVGAGGNLTVEQVGDNSTLKGDPTFMQDMNTAWHKADQATKNSLKDWVHLDGTGKVVRIDAIKDHPGLEKLVRSFADGKTYVGVGAWNGSPGAKGSHDSPSAWQRLTRLFR